MATYKIIGGDQKEYGPVSAEELRRWFAEGRVNASTLVLGPDSTEWKPLSAWPDFADLLTSPGAAAPPPLSAPPGLVTPQSLDRDYALDIGNCVTRSWNLLSNNFGQIFGGVAIYLLIQAGMSAFAQIPLLGILVSVASLIVAGPLLGGVYMFLLKNIRRQPAPLGDIFCGFPLAFGQLLLGYLVVAILTGLAAAPGIVVMLVAIFAMIAQHGASFGMVALATLGFIIAMIPALYLSVAWMFALPLIIDRGMEFWPAMTASRRLTNRHWWLCFGLVIIMALVNLAGFLACCVGIFVSFPLALGMLMYAYEDIFPAATRPAA